MSLGIFEVGRDGDGYRDRDREKKQGDSIPLFFACDKEYRRL
jgi:hypothetical protein